MIGLENNYLMNNKGSYVFVLMGVSGSGKSIIAKNVSYDLNTSFLDGDFLHPKENILKMQNGIPLNDDDRKPWLKLINNAVFAMRHVQPISIIACSALKRSYRDMIRENNQPIHFIYLKGSASAIAERLASRQGHYQKEAMLQSQFAALEEPNADEKDVHTINIERSLVEVVNEVKKVIKIVYIN